MKVNKSEFRVLANSGATVCLALKPFAKRSIGGSDRAFVLYLKKSTQIERNSVQVSSAKY